MRTLLTVFLCLTACGGCASFPKADKFALKNPFNKKDKEPEPYPLPVKMASTWTPDTLTTPGKRPTRGFGGRIFFYNEKSQPVPVEGELTITAYLESDVPSEPTKVRRFGFTAEQLTQHYSQSDLGASYSIWVPWDVDGGPGQRITMVPSFQSPEMAGPIQGSATGVMLPGPVPSRDIIDRARRTANLAPRTSPNSMYGQSHQVSMQQGPMQQGPVQQVGFANQAGTYGQQTPRSGLSTLTIPMESKFSRNVNR